MSKVASLFDDVVKSPDDVVMDATELAKTRKLLTLIKS